VRLFYPAYTGKAERGEFSVIFEAERECPRIECGTLDRGLKILIGADKYNFDNNYDNIIDKLIRKRQEIRFLAGSLYSALSKHTGRSLPWGSLTGIRPTKLVYELLSGCQGDGGIDKPAKLVNTPVPLTTVLKEIGERYFVSQPKLELLGRVVEAQRGYMAEGERPVNLYINIPVCPTRCGYCSFAAGTYKECKGYLDEYTDKLTQEIERDRERLRAGGYQVYSVYVGGGTPTVLSAPQLDKVLAAIGDTENTEFTCEAGRPDSIDGDKLSVLKARGVNRICINPQSFNDVTLAAVGRSHTAADVVRAYELAQKYGFVINTDLIAGLAGESLSDFGYSVDAVLELAPHNITVHTLSCKRGSEYAGQNTPSAARRRPPLSREGNFSNDIEISVMVDLAYNKLTAAGYESYYLYRQKSQLGALENAGYTKPGYQCRNNISVMEETVSVLAAGAGGISKLVKKQAALGGSPHNTRIERYANCKDIKLYLEQFEARYKAKAEFFFF